MTKLAIPLFLLLNIVVLIAYSKSSVQIIHNSADLSASSVDVYLNETLAINDFSFRTATEFLEIEPGTYTVSIAPKSSSSVADAVYSTSVTFDDGMNYSIVASGIVSPQGYSPAEDFSLHVYAYSPVQISSDNTHVLVFHGATDAPAVDLVETAVPAGVLASGLSYSSFAGHLDLPTTDYILDINNMGNTVASYSAPLGSLSLGGIAITVVASGFLSPESNSDGYPFGLFVALPSGGNLVALPAHQYGVAKIQVIHASADAVADSVDVYINESLAIDNFAYLSSTGFIDFRSGLPTQISIAPKSSSSVADAVYSTSVTFDDGMNYSIVASGIVSPQGYSPAEDFSLHVYAYSPAQISSDNTHVLVFHGATDAPAVDLVETAVPAGVLASGLPYGSFAGHLDLPTADYILDINSMGNTVASYSAPLESLSLGGTAITVVASGFLSPESNSDGYPFGLFVALPSGGNLVALKMAEIEKETTNITKDSKVPVSVEYFSNVLKIILKENKKPVTINLATASGIILETLETEEHYLEMEIDNYADGVYLLNVDFGKYIETIVILKL